MECRVGGTDPQHAWVGRETTYTDLFVKSERKGQLGRPRRRWEDDTRIDVTETRSEGVDVDFGLYKTR
jgi:hypothetical protein